MSPHEKWAANVGVILSEAKDPFNQRSFKVRILRLRPQDDNFRPPIQMP